MVYGDAHQFIGVAPLKPWQRLYGKKDYVRAEDMYLQALRVFIDTVHEEHTNIGIAHMKLGRLLLRPKRYTEAEPETLRDYETLTKLVSPTNSFVVAAKVDLNQTTALNRKWMQIAIVLIELGR